MFFWITGELDLSRSEQFDAIENLGEAGFAGRHLVLGDKAAIDSIVAHEGFSRKSSAYYRSVKSKYSQIAGIKGRIPKVNVSPGCYSPSKGDEWEVPLESFRTDDAVEKALAIVEHMYDYKVVVSLANTSLREIGVNGWVGIELMPVSGGGGGTSLALSVHQKNARSLGICVVDSDRPHIRGPLGSTARGCEKVYDERWGWSLHVIGGREIENLVPPEIFEVGGVEAKLGGWQAYRDETWAVHGYADTKKGDCLCRFRSIPPGDLSFQETSAALANFPALDDIDCPSEKCRLCDANEGALGSLAAALERYPLAGLKKIPTPISALSDLLKQIVSYGAARRWNIV